MQDASLMPRTTLPRALLLKPSDAKPTFPAKDVAAKINPRSVRAGSSPSSKWEAENKRALTAAATGNGTNFEAPCSRYPLASSMSKRNELENS
eukprot:1159981-Pelagomonas_calceolata.AAC.3